MFLQTNPTRRTILLSIFISLLYMFRATTCPSSGEITVSMWHWYLSLCMGGIWSAGWSETKYTKQNCAPSWIYLQDCTRMYGQQNIKSCKCMCVQQSIYFLMCHTCESYYSNEHLSVLSDFIYHLVLREELCYQIEALFPSSAKLLLSSAPR